MTYYVKVFLIPFKKSRYLYLKTGNLCTRLMELYSYYIYTFLSIHR